MKKILKKIKNKMSIFNSILENTNTIFKIKEEILPNLSTETLKYNLFLISRHLTNIFDLSINNELTEEDNNIYIFLINLLNKISNSYNKELNTRDCSTILKYKIYKKLNNENNSFYNQLFFIARNFKSRKDYENKISIKELNTRYKKLINSILEYKNAYNESYVPDMDLKNYYFSSEKDEKSIGMFLILDLMFFFKKLDMFTKEEKIEHIELCKYSFSIIIGL